MKYIYINKNEDRLVYVSDVKSQDHAQILDEYIVSDTFDLSKEVIDEEGNTVVIPNAVTATDFLSRYNSDYVQQRLSAYPTIEEQLDKIYHFGIDAWKEEIAAIKAKYPKSN